MSHSRKAGCRCRFNLGLVTLLALSWQLSCSFGATVVSTWQQLKDALTNSEPFITFTSSTGTITFAEPLIISKPKTIDGGSAFTLSGGGSSAIFAVTGEKVVLKNLIFSSGRSTNTGGGALYVFPGAKVLVTNCSFFGNSAYGSDGANGANGANSTEGSGSDGGSGSPGNFGIGGAVYNRGQITLGNCRFSTNSAVGGKGGNGGSGGTGRVNGGNGGAAANGVGAYGGAVCNQQDATIIDCTFSGNTATGGAAGTGGTNGTGAFLGRMGSGAAGGGAYGGAVYNDKYIVLWNNTFANNNVKGGNSSTGGMLVNGSGQDGSTGGEACGGGLSSVYWGAITNSTFFNNQAVGGSGGTGGTGNVNAGNGGNGGLAAGGSLYISTSFRVVNCTFSSSGALGGVGGLAGNGSFQGKAGSLGGSYGGNLSTFNGGLTVRNSISATNTFGGGAYGSITDAGYNISADSTLVYASTSLRNTNPKLGGLANNGGPTQTMRLLAGSPAIDKIPSQLAPETDQRGVKRPLPKETSNSDIGAVEFGTAAAINVTWPGDQYTTNGGSVTFSLSATGGYGPLSYQWYFNDASVEGATDTSYTVSPATTANQGPYTVTVKDALGTLTNGPVYVRFLPVITNQPASTNVALGGTASFSVGASGSPPLRYQWFFNADTLLSVQTNATLVLTNVQSANVGDYTVVVSNDGGSATSTPPARLELLVAPAPARLALASTADGQLQLSASAPTGQTYIVQVSTNLVHWAPVCTSTVPFSVNQQCTNAAAQFYRLKGR